MFNNQYGLNQAVIDLLKTMTRRAIPKKTLDFVFNDFTHAYYEATLDKLTPKEALEQYFFDEYPNALPYKVGDILAIAQDYTTVKHDMELLVISRKATEEQERIYNSLICMPYDHPGFKNKMFVSSDLMPKHIKITDVRIEQLQDITDEDCLKEGIFQFGDPFNEDRVEDFGFIGATKHYLTPREAFAALIDKVSCKGTWKSNPWVFVYNFKYIEK